MGCSKNLVDSETLMSMFEARGYHCVHDSKNPTGEIAVINTCGFIQDAKEESINTILEFAQAKAEGRLKKLFVMGCLSQRYQKELEAEIPQVDKFYGKFDFKSIKDYDANLLYKIMAQGKADAAPVSTTDGQLATSKLQLVKDNKNIWPPYNLVPLANKQAVKRYPKMEKTLNKVDAKLTTKAVTQLNKQVGVDGQNYRTVAQNWYNKNMK